MSASPSKSAVPIEMPFGGGAHLSGLKKPCIKWGVEFPHEKGQFLGLSCALKSIGSLCCAVRSEIDYLIEVNPQ